jgi:hypothetical protein
MNYGEYESENGFITQAVDSESFTLSCAVSIIAIYRSPRSLGANLNVGMESLE